MLRGSRRDEANVGSSLCVLPKLPPWNWPGPWPRWARWLRDEGNDQVHVEHSVHLFIKEFATSIVAPKWFDAAVLTRFQIISVFLAGAVYIIYIYNVYDVCFSHFFRMPLWSANFFSQVTSNSGSNSRSALPEKPPRPLIQFQGSSDLVFLNQPLGLLVKTPSCFYGNQCGLALLVRVIVT